MSLWSVADRLTVFTVPVLLGILAALFLLYLNRGWVAIWLLRRGIKVAERVLYEFLDITGIEDPRWALLRYPDQIHFRLGLVIAEEKNRVSVFVPSVPKLVPGDLVFVDRKYVKLLPNLTLREGMELLITLGAASNKDIMKSILAQMEE